LATTKLNPLQHDVPLIHAEGMPGGLHGQTPGTPTPYFIQLLQQLLEEKATTDDAVDAGLQSVDQFRIIARDDSGVGPVEQLTLTEVLDFMVGTDHGDILFRGATEWERLPPGDDGQVLTTHDAGADPAWEDPSGGSDWVNLTFTTTSALWNSGNWFASSESITLTGTDKIEMVLQCDRDATEYMAIAISPDVNNCYMSVIQNDNNWVLYSYDTIGGAGTAISGGTVNQVESGAHEIRMIIHLGKSGSNDRISSRANSIDAKSARTANTNLRVTTNKIYIRVPNDTLANKINCKYRINSPEGN